MENDGVTAMLNGFNADLPDGAEEYRVDIGHEGALTGSEYGADSLATVFEGVQDQVMETVVAGAWPRCPRHGRHPLLPTAEGWKCPSSGDRWPYGSMNPQVPPPERNLPDGEVRWFLAEQGWGVIAHHEGDLFVHFSDIIGSGHRQLLEGERVDFKVIKKRQGLLRRALGVRRAS